MVMESAVTDKVPRELELLVVTAPAAVTVRFCPAPKDPNTRSLVPLSRRIEPEPDPINSAALLVDAEKSAVPPAGRLAVRDVAAIKLPVLVVLIPAAPEVRLMVGLV